MASPEAILELRQKIGDTEAPFKHTDEYLSTLIDSFNDDTDAAASVVWRQKAASYAEMTDITEAGSSRKNSQLYKNAQEMAAYYGGGSGGVGSTDGRSRTRQIVRP